MLHVSDAELAAAVAAEMAAQDARGQAIVTGYYVADGGAPVDPVWHNGPEAEAVYFERYALGIRQAHGWIDSVSRRIVQTG